MTSFDRSRSLLFAGALLVAGALGLVQCGGHGRNAKTPSTDTTTIVGAPDNNSYNNPSLADTAYEKNRTRPMTDTMKHPDTVRNRP